MEVETDYCIMRGRRNAECGKMLCFGMWQFVVGKSCTDVSEESSQ